MSRRKKSGRGALMILALLLAGSGALRMGEGVGRALAAGDGHDTEGSAQHATAQTCPAPPEALAAALSARESRLEADEAALADRLAALDLAEKAIADRMAAMEAAEAKLSSTLSLADGAAEEDLTRLTEVYQTMKPKDAAKLFEAMSPEFAAGFLGRMRPDAAAAVFAGMTPDKAYAISVLLAGRNALVPTE